MTGKSKGRLPSAEERDLFEETLKDAKLLAKRKPAAPKPAAPKPAPAAPTVSTPVPSKVPRGSTAGLDGNTAERLRRGQLDPEARLDLHGMTESTAHRALVTFLRAASSRGLRLVLIVTGKGKPVAPDAPFDLELSGRARGVLNAMTPRWLEEPELAGFVADVRLSHRRHGGAGALYVYLRKLKSR